MRGTRLVVGVLAACTALGGAVTSAPAVEEASAASVWAITGARIVTMAGAPLAAGTVVIRDGLIDAVGPAVKVPADAEVVDGTGLTVTPALIDAFADALLKLPERPAPPTSPEAATDQQRGLTPHRRAWEYVVLGKATLAKYHAVGIATVQVVPTAGLLPGQTAVLSLSTEDVTSATLRREAALAVTFTPGAGYPNSLMGVMAFLRQAFLDAAHYDAHLARWTAAPSGVPRPVYDARAEILARAVSGALPVVFLCKNQHDISRALRLAEEFRLAAVVADAGGEAFRVVPALQRARVPVLAAVTFKAPPSAIWSQKTEADRQRAENELYPAGPAQLAAAGVRFAFASLGCDSPHAFLAGVRTAVAAGLPAERALRALTADAATILGVGRLLGTIETGKIANLVVSEGDILAEGSKVRFVFADGRRFVVKERKLGEGEAPTVNVTGRWELAVERGMGAGTTVTVTFSQEESSLSGTYTTSRGSVEFADGEVAGNQIAFEVTMSFAGRTIDLFVTGTVEGDTIRGTVTTARSSNPFTAKRIP